MTATLEENYGNHEHTLIFKEEVYQIVGACMEVHNTLGPGFLEPVYQEALEYEFGLQKITTVAQAPLLISYKGKVLEKFYVADFIAYDQIILEIKALGSLEPTHMSKVLNYLKATGFPLGLLVNFGAKSLEWKRVAN